MWERESRDFDIETSSQGKISTFKVSALSAIGWFPDTMNFIENGRKWVSIHNASGAIPVRRFPDFGQGVRSKVLLTCPGAVPEIRQEVGMREPKVGGRWVDGEWVETLGGVPIDDIPSQETPQEELVNTFSQGLRGETPVEGEDNSWSCIGGIKFGSKALIKSPEGDPIFVLSLDAAVPDVKHNYANFNFPVLVKRAPDG